MAMRLGELKPAAPELSAVVVKTRSKPMSELLKQFCDVTAVSFAASFTGSTRVRSTHCKRNPASVPSDHVRSSWKRDHRLTLYNAAPC